MSDQKNEDKADVLNPQAAITRARRWYRNYRDSHNVHPDTDMRLVRAFNIYGKAVKCGRKQKYAGFLLSWIALNCLYVDGTKLSIKKKAKGKISEIDPITTYLRTIIRQEIKDHAKGDGEFLDCPERIPKGPWSSLILMQYRDSCITLAKCRWLNTSKPNGNNITVPQIKKGMPMRLKGVTLCVYNLRNLLVHGDLDPSSSFLSAELEAANEITPAVVAMAFQCMLEHPTRKWGRVRFGEQDGWQYEPRLD